MASEMATVLVFCMAGLVLIQTAYLLLALIFFDRKLRKAAEELTEIHSAVGRTLRSTSGILSRLVRLSDHLPAAESAANRVIDLVASRLGRFDQTAGRGLNRVASRIEDTGRRVEYALSQFTRQTSQVTRKVRIPSQRLSALIRGIEAALKTLRHGPAAVPLQDEESFI